MLAIRELDEDLTRRLRRDAAHVVPTFGDQELEAELTTAAVAIGRHRYDRFTLLLAEKDRRRKTPAH